MNCVGGWSGSIKSRCNYCAAARMFLGVGGSASKDACRSLTMSTRMQLCALLQTCACARAIVDVLREMPKVPPLGAITYIPTCGRATKATERFRTIIAGM